MGGATIICPNCKKSFEISDAIQHQIEEELPKVKTKQTEILRFIYDEKFDNGDGINYAPDHDIPATKKCLR